MSEICRKYCEQRSAGCEVLAPVTASGKPVVVPDGYADSSFYQICKVYTCKMGEIEAEKAVARVMVSGRTDGLVSFGSSTKPDGRYIEIESGKVYFLVDGEMLFTGRTVDLSRVKRMFEEL